MFRIVSDLHLESMGSSYFLPKCEDEKTTVLILAGDICEFRLLESHEPYEEFLKDCNKRFREIIYVPGNHEYYGTELNKFREWKELIEKKFNKIKVMDRDSTILTVKTTNGPLEIKIVAATLWTDMNNNDPLTLLEGHRSIPDSRMIMGDFSPETTVEENNKARSFINQALIDSSETCTPTIVVTHHGPTFRSVAPIYEYYPLEQNCLFMNTGMEEYFEEFWLKLWVHGHTHESIDHILGHGCRVICNPKGLTSYYFASNDTVSMCHGNRNYDDRLAFTLDDLYF